MRRALLGELLREKLVDDLGVALAAHLLHALADEEPDDLGVSILVARHLVGVRGDDRVDDGLDRAGVRHLLHAALLHDGGRVFVLVHDGGEDLFGLFGGDGVLDEQADKLDGALG